MPASRRRPAPVSTPQPPDTLPVAIFYEDIAAAQRALHSLRDLLRRRNDSRSLQPMLWQIGLLEHAHWIRLATTDVARAELCILSLGQSSNHAREIATWFRELSPLNPGRWITLAPFAAIPEETELMRHAG